MSACVWSLALSLLIRTDTGARGWRLPSLSVETLMTCSLTLSLSATHETLMTCSLSHSHPHSLIDELAHDAHGHGHEDGDIPLLGKAKDEKEGHGVCVRVCHSPSLSHTHTLMKRRGIPMRKRDMGVCLRETCGLSVSLGQSKGEKEGRGVCVYVRASVCLSPSHSLSASLRRRRMKRVRKKSMNTDIMKKSMYKYSSLLRRALPSMVPRFAFPGCFGEPEINLIYVCSPCAATASNCLHICLTCVTCYSASISEY